MFSYYVSENSIKNFIPKKLDLQVPNITLYPFLIVNPFVISSVKYTSVLNLTFYYLIIKFNTIGDFTSIYIISAKARTDLLTFMYFFYGL